MIDYTRSPFARRLIELRVRRDLSQGKMAEFLSMSRGTLANYENDKRVPGPLVLIGLASRLGVSVDYLLGNSDFELPFESGIKYGIIKQVRPVKFDDLQPYTPRSEQVPLVAERNPEAGYSPGS